MGCEEKWTLPVVYVPWWDRRHLTEVLEDVVEVGDVTVVFLWFHWSHDLPASSKPEYEPIAIAFHKGWPKLIFYRPHYTHRFRRPMLHGRSAVIYISPAGHAPVVSKHGITLLSMTPLFKRIDRKALKTLLVPGSPPERFLVLKGVNFREWVIETLTRPETDKYIKGNTRGGMLRYFLHMLMASRCADMGDLKNLYQHLLKAYLSLPLTMKLNPYMMYLIDYAGGVRKMINENTQLSEENKKYLRKKFFNIMLETPIFFFDKPSKEQIKDAVDELRYTVDQLKNI